MMNDSFIREYYVLQSGDTQWNNICTNGNGDPRHDRAEEEED